MTFKPVHTFHIPVMGLAYTIDSPIRVAQYGISSVISITDDDLIEKMRAIYCEKFSQPYQEITRKIQDYRAERITHYLNLVDSIVKEKFENFKKDLLESKIAFENFMGMLPQKSTFKINLQNIIAEGINIKKKLKAYIDENFYAGEIDVNIMTKLDKDNFDSNGQLPIEFNDAHAALRGFAKSNLSSSVVLSAGMNPRLFSYFESFKDFFPDLNYQLKKKIILKVSDFRSAMIQGNYLAKKGLWVSEYRIESGLNCGGHAFATEGNLMGSILEEFKQKKEQLIQSAHDLMIKVLSQKELPIPMQPMEIKISVQGGVGTAEEHAFLMEHYGVDMVGWGSPFLLVPEATLVDNDTRILLAEAKETDFYLSPISPLGIPFNSVKGTTNEALKQKRILENKAGSSCPKRFLALSKEYGVEGICTASNKYQQFKLDELKVNENNHSPEEIRDLEIKITEKSCLCVGLSNASLIEYAIPMKGQDQGIVVCPGPNMAYFNKEVSLNEMVQHIYGNNNIMHDENRPHMFLKELGMYVDYLKNEISNFTQEISTGQIKKWNTFKSNLQTEIVYYQELFANISFFQQSKKSIQSQLLIYQEKINNIVIPTLVAVTT